MDDGRERERKKSVMTILRQKKLAEQNSKKRKADNLKWFQKIVLSRNKKINLFIFLGLVFAISSVFLVPTPK